MKKQFKLMALASATMLFAACSQENLLSPQEQLAQAPENNVIQFGTYLGKTGTTRAYTAGPIANENNATKGVTDLKVAEFAVFSYFTGADNYVISTPSTTNLAPNFMYNQQITWGTSLSTPAWTYSPAKYWPNGIDKDNASTPSNTATQDADGKLSFFAYAPYIATPSTAYDEASDGTLPSAITGVDKVKKNANTKGISAMTTNDWTGNVWVKYLMPNANISQAVDLLWGTNGLTTYNETDAVDPTLASIGEGYNINLTKQKVTDRVKFLFKHALTKIGGNIEETEDLTEPATACNFEIKVDVDGNNGDNSTTYFPTGFDKASTLVTVKKVEIMDGASAATAHLAEAGTTSDLVTSGWFNIETGSWDATAVNTGATYSITANSTDNDATNDIYTLNPKIKEGTVSNAAGAAWNTTNSGGAEGVEVTAKPLFAKETVPGLLLIPGGNQTIYISINYVVRTADPKLATGFTEVEQTITNKVSLTGLQPNKFYKIIMHLGLTSVKFEAKVADWATAAGGTYTTDGSYTTGGTANEESIWLPSNVE
jgi:hypothetical protein